MSKTIDLVGEKFGNLTVLSRSESNGWGEAMWACSCDCGSSVIVRGSALRRGHTTSCGCKRIEATIAKNTKHGLSRRNAKVDRLYAIHSNMLQRCENPKNKAYQNYGGRGIRVCEEWRHTFAPFEKWALENGYSDELTIDRIDVNGDYCPENCRFITLQEQNQNRRNNTILTFNGEQKCLTEWARVQGIGQSVLSNRLKRGWSVEKALTYPVDHRKGRWGKK